MDWARAVGLNRAALLRVVAALFVLAGMDEGAMPMTLTRRVRRRVLALLRPAELAARRLLVVIAARGLTVDVPESRPRPLPEAPAVKDVRQYHP